MSAGSWKDRSAGSQNHQHDLQPDPDNVLILYHSLRHAFRKGLHENKIIFRKIPDTDIILLTARGTDKSPLICLEKKDGRPVKALLTRQNITEVKEKELRIQAERARADRKERQYQIAIMSSSLHAAPASVHPEAPGSVPSASALGQ